MFTYNEENKILDTLEVLEEQVRSPAIKQLIKETHENNIMLKQLIAYINNTIANSNKENNKDFNRNVLANIVSNNLDFIKLKRI